MKFLRSLTILFFVFAFHNSNAKGVNLDIKITKNLRCLICQGQSVYDSDSEFATSLKMVVKNQIEQGLSENQIYESLIEKYGDWILYDPKFTINTYFLWFLPLLIFLIGGAIIFKKLVKIEK